MVYEFKLRELVLVRLEKRRIWTDLVSVFNYLKVNYREDRTRLFSDWLSKKARGISHELQ